ncbi:MAG: DsbA family protein [Microlunatus sp.]|nr:DsbA family protein [Microlunatus sp.]MDN5805000.1 DsbA family protein [Microlunatus sp.]
MPKRPNPTTNSRQQARDRARLEAERLQRKRKTTQIIVVVVVALVAISIVASAILLGTSGRKDRVPTASTSVTVGGTSVPFDVDGSAFQVGKSDAKATLDLWVDYSCSHCQEFEAASNDVLAQKVGSGELKVRYHNLQFVTAYGAQAGSAAACVATYAPQQWWALNAALYANHSAESDGWKGAQFADFAQQLGVESQDALTCIGDQRYTSWISDNTSAAADAGVTGTPTLFLNGQQIDTVGGAQLAAKIDEAASQ